MKTSIYIGNEKIQAVTGMVSGNGLIIESAVTAALPEGALINGVVTDSRMLTDTIQAIYQRNLRFSKQKIRLTISSNLFNAKRHVLPMVGKKQILSLVKEEFSDLGGGEDFLYDYVVLEPHAQGGGFVGLLSAVRRDFIANYIHLFGALGITIGGINTPLSSLINLVGKMKLIEDKTCIVLVLDGNILDAALFVKGAFCFSIRSRLLLEQGGIQLEDEISRIVSSLVQFNQSEHSGINMSHLYLCGTRPQEKSVLQNISRTFGLEPGAFGTGAFTIRKKMQDFELADYVIPVGNLIRK